MAYQAEPVMLYASRFKAFLWALVGMGFVAIDLLFYFVLPTPTIQTQPWMYQEPGRTIFFVLLLGLSGVATLFYLFWTFTPSPLVTVDASGLVYQLFPFIKRSIRWLDVEDAAALKSRVSFVSSLTVWFATAPHAESTYRGKSLVKLSFYQNVMPLSSDDFVALLCRYHEVSYRK